MATHINLSSSHQRNFSLPQWPLIFFEGISPLAVLMLALLLVPPTKFSFTPLEQFSQIEFFKDLRSACLALDTSPQMQELKDNFLTNKRLNDPALRQTFQSAGLSHLLALSGSQTGPVSSFVCVFFISLGLSCLTYLRPLARHSIVVGLRMSGLVAEFAALLCLVGLFQSTGALNRILSSKITLIVLQPINSPGGTSPLKQVLLDTKIRMLLPWLFACLLGKNPVHDLSFLLSALGANTAQVVSTAIQAAWTNANKKTPGEKSSLSKIAIDTTNKLAQWTLITALTSSLMCCFCFQLWPVSNLSDKVLANLLAGPLVLFLITPAALLVITCIALQIEVLLLPACYALDHGLFALVFIAESFSNPEALPQTSPIPFLTSGASHEWFLHPYLGLCLIILTLTGFQVFIHKFKAFQLREVF